ncbi:MAG TPA: deoxyribonuclease IV [Candidatus Limnocylindrales bacterium]|nr:deoxyribonuclease IV [Candidatus Limnocylindrales bacterium]
MTSDPPRLGLHLPHARGLVKALERAAAIGAEAVQVFADNPTAWRRRASPSPELPRFRERLADLGVDPVAIHAPYLVNLAGGDERFRGPSIDLLASDLRSGPGFGARFVNVHVGSHLGAGADSAAAAVADAVACALEATDDVADRPTVVLENSAGGGNGYGSTIDELAAILAALTARGVPDSAVAICLDTAHLWGAGYDLGAPTAVDDLFATFDARIGLDRLAMVHFNDSRSQPGSRADRHEHLGGGRIGATALGAVLRHPAVAGKPVYLETPGMDHGYDAINLARARALLAGEPLGPLPPEAFDLPPRHRGRATSPGRE